MLELSPTLHPGCPSGLADGEPLLQFPKPLDLRNAAIHEQLDAIHETGIARSQEQRHGRNLLRPPDFTARNQRLRSTFSRPAPADPESAYRSCPG